MSNHVSHLLEAESVSYPHFAALYNWMMRQTLVQRMFDPLRREIVGQAHGVVLEVGAGGGQNFPVKLPVAWVGSDITIPAAGASARGDRAAFSPWPDRCCSLAAIHHQVCEGLLFLAVEEPIRTKSIEQYRPLRN